MPTEEIRGGMAAHGADDLGFDLLKQQNEAERGQRYWV
jgi:hypothetical protein